MTEREAGKESQGWNFRYLAWINVGKGHDNSRHG